MKNTKRSYYTEQILLDESFMTFPKWLMYDPEFSKLSNEAKILYINLKDRFKLSLKNQWIDKHGNVFVVCKRESMEKMLNKSERTVKKIIEELKKAELIEEKQNGQNMPNFIYLLSPTFKGYQDYSFEEDNWKQNDEKKKAGK